MDVGIFFNRVVLSDAALIVGSSLIPLIQALPRHRPRYGFRSLLLVLGVGWYANVYAAYLAAVALLVALRRMPAGEREDR